MTFPKGVSTRRLGTTRQLTLLVAAAAALAAAAQAQTPPYALFQYSTLTASGNAITATWVPIVTANGTVYKNVTFLFDVDASGDLTLAAGYPQVVPSPVVVVSSFKAGNYVGPSTFGNGQFDITVSGPGVRSGGNTEWSLATTSGAYPYTYPSSATWYVGPIASNPLAARLKAAGITSTAMSYGTATSGCECGQWGGNTLIGVSQIGGSITFTSFTLNGVDSGEPVDQITYTPVTQP